VTFVVSRTRALLLGVALILLSNAIVLAGVAYNRSGEQESALQLTERELSLQRWHWPQNENSSVDLYLKWRVAYSLPPDDQPRSDWYHGIHWLQPEQLRELGFEVEGDLNSGQRANQLSSQLSRRAWLVLEHDGPAYQAELDILRRKLERAASLVQARPDDDQLGVDLQAARSALEYAERAESRLLIVDAGPDAAALRARYPDRHRYAIVGGRLEVSVQGAAGRRRLVARVKDVDVSAIRVPHAYRSVVELFLSNDRYVPGASGESRFVATVNFGRRFEPWIVDFTPLE
jgi:hypothetical protein